MLKYFKIKMEEHHEKEIKYCFMHDTDGNQSFGCKKKEEAPEPTETVSEAEETETETGKDGMARSYLTGEWIDADLAKKKPVAIMIGNTNDALPQYGLSQADVLYEAPAEGGITRLMPIFQDYSGLDKIGSVRSCRHYYAYYAMEFDAIYIHYGQAIYATELLESGKVEDLNGLEGAIDSATFYRDKSRKAPHNAFVSTDGSCLPIIKDIISLMKMMKKKLNLQTEQMQQWFSRDII